MKNNKIVLVSIASLTLMSIIGLSFIKSGQSVAMAYTHTTKGSLPSTIKLKNNSENDIRTYYSSLSSLSQSERQGDNLLKNLKPILSNNQTYYSYDSESGKSNCIWLMYEIIDRDWSKSPVSDIVNSSSSTYISGASYNSSTNELTGYKYGVTDPFIHALYYDREYENYITAWFNHSPRTKEFVMEREHIWPKSHGFDKEESTTGGARGDPMHLWAAEGYTNGIHSNYYYGNVDKTKSYTNCGDYDLTTYTVYSTTEYAHHNYLGTSASLGSGTVFEPQDSDKGDIARAVFYMAARYNNIANNDNNIDANNPNLYLNDVIDNRTGTSNSSTPYNLGLLHDLLEWHHADPVDEFEIHRNNLLFNNYTNNRNPFIDFPEWADYIWGTPESDMTYSDPTGYATPSTDTINGYNAPNPSGEPVTISTSISSYAAANSWSNSSKYTSITLDSNITITITDGGSNSGKYYTNGNNWRIYQNESPTLTVAAASGYTIDSVAFTYTVANTGTLLDSSSNVVASDDQVNVNAGSVSFTVGNTGEATNGNVQITDISVTYRAVAAPVSSISASVNKTYHVGEIISKSDITVLDNNSNSVNNFTFSEDGYQFKYLDAASGGALTNKNFTISYNELETTLTVQVSREAYAAPNDVVHSLTTANNDFSGVEGSSSSPVDNTITKNGISYMATRSYKYNSMLALKGYKSGSEYATDGVVYNVTKFSTSIKTVTYTLTDSITALIQYSDDCSSWTSINDGHMHYFKISFPNTFTGYVDFTAINVTLFGEESPASLSNYIMYADTSNQCLTKLDTAIRHFENMSSLSRSTFMTSNDYVIKTARERLNAWLVNQEKEITYQNGDYVVVSSSALIFDLISAPNNSTQFILIIIASSASILIVGAYYLYRKRREQH